MHGFAYASSFSIKSTLCCLGLIHVNHGSAITEYLINQLKETTSDVRVVLGLCHVVSVQHIVCQVVRHGGCLGLGLAALGTARNG